MNFHEFARAGNSFFSPWKAHFKGAGGILRGISRAKNEDAAATEVSYFIHDLPWRKNTGFSGAR